MPVPSQQQQYLTWGVLQLSGPDDSEASFSIDSVREGTNFGNPQPVVEIVQSLLTDGVLAAVTGWENREIPLHLRISANDGEAMAEAEAALMQQVLLDQPPPLEWIGPAGSSAPTVFDVVVARLDQDTADGWDVDEKWQGHRYYLLTLTCLPFARAVEATTVPALPVPADPETEDRTVVDDCTSTTGWSRETNGGSPTGPTLVGGQAVEVTATIDSASDYLRLVRTGSIAVPTDYYLAVDVLGASLGSGWSSGTWRARLDGVWVTPVARTYDGESSSIRLFFADVGTISELAIEVDFTSGKGGTGGTTPLTVYNVATTDTLGSSSTSTRLQQSRLVDVLGSMPTNAVLRFYDATPAVLGKEMLVYTTRNTDWQPNLRRWLDTSEAPTTDASMISGARHTLATPTVYLVPAYLLTSGTYAIMARVRDASGGSDLTWTAKMTTLGGADAVASSVEVSGTVTIPITWHGGLFEILDLGALVLPVVEVEGANFAVSLTLEGAASMQIDEVWLFNLDDGTLTWVRDEEELTWIEIRSPDLGASRPSVYGGRNVLGTGSACIDWKCQSFGAHRFEPGTMQIFTVCTDSLVSQCEIEFFPRFHSHVWGEGTS